jgi:hypothetical protein
VSTLAHVTEAEGLATIALGSQRNQIVAAAPPRGLWCDFPLGRPLGRPGDPEFQHRVLARAFALLTATEPVMDVFPEAVEDGSEEVIACPLPPVSDDGLHPAVAEAKGLRPAFERAVARFGNRAGTGRVVDADHAPEAIEAFVRVADGTPWRAAGIPGIPARVAQDVRGYYETAAVGLVDHVPSAWSGTQWLFEETQAGKVVLAARAAMCDAGEKQPIWFYMAPGDR